MTAETAATTTPTLPPSRGYWSEVWRQFRKRRIAMVALVYIVFLSIIGICAPLIAGTRPIVCKYKGQIYYPCLAYFNPRWEPAIFFKDKFRQIYPKNLKKKDPQSWAVWPLVYQDPYRRIKEGEWPDQPENKFGTEGVPDKFNIMGTDQQGWDVFAQIVHGTTIAL
jgi:peptide/nickel transport system permease protein